MITQEQKEKIKDICHKSGEGDIRGACGNPCYGCWRTEEILKLLEERTCDHKNSWKSIGIAPLNNGLNSVASSIFCEKCGLIKIYKE